MKKLNLTKDVILNKKFTTELSGYNPTEVDKYFDQIIEDYINFHDQIKILEDKVVEKNQLLESQTEELAKFKIEIENLKLQLKEAGKSSNYEILQELKKLQKS